MGCTNERPPVLIKGLTNPFRPRGSYPYILKAFVNLFAFESWKASYLVLTVRKLKFNKTFRVRKWSCGRVARHQVFVQTGARMLGWASRGANSGAKSEKRIEKPAQYSQAAQDWQIVTKVGKLKIDQSKFRVHLRLSPRQQIHIIYTAYSSKNIACQKKLPFELAETQQKNYYKK